MIPNSRRHINKNGPAGSPVVADLGAVDLVPIRGIHDTRI